MRGYDLVFLAALAALNYDEDNNDDNKNKDNDNKESDNKCNDNNDNNNEDNKNKDNNNDHDEYRGQNFYVRAVSQFCDVSSL